MNSQELEAIIRDKVQDVKTLVVSDVSGGCGQVRDNGMWPGRLLWVLKKQIDTSHSCLTSAAQAFDVIIVSPAFQG